jgi:hypothetical protein
VRNQPVGRYAHQAFSPSLNAVGTARVRLALQPVARPVRVLPAMPLSEYEAQGCYYSTIATGSLGRSYGKYKALRASRKRDDEEDGRWH